MYQATVYQYNQRAETLIPQRRGTSYYGPDNHKPMVAYKGLNVEFDFFVKDTDRKPQSLDNKTYTATVLDRTSKASVLTKTLIPTDYSQGKLVLKLDHEETLALDAKLYDLIITYTVTDVGGSYGGLSDQNNRITFVLEIKDGAVAELRPSETVSNFNPDGNDNIGDRMTGPVLNNSISGLNTVQVHFTDYLGTYKMQGSLSLQPLSSDWFDISGQTHTLSSITTAVKYHTFVGMYYFVRVVHTPDLGNTGTLDKVIYRS
tara:strand:+ start:8205 stop:8984 length:780 start_codon:yes stop_codon:yes gene_type:complete